MRELTYDELRARVERWFSKGRKSEVEKSTEELVLLVLDMSAGRPGVGIATLVVAAKQLTMAATVDPIFAEFVS
ncbi:MAG: hypothetical protein FJ044_04110 [Candidatus Cloacimonetes bacterium]|nr:hypothetical protein [Candidatus Cloacimonadota bacterium]